MTSVSDAKLESDRREEKTSGIKILQRVKTEVAARSVIFRKLRAIFRKGYKS